MGANAHLTNRLPDHGAWAEMLAGICEKNSRLGDLVAKRWPKRTGTPLLAELERERSRVARELHAGAGQPLAGIKLHLEILDESICNIPDSASLDATRVTIGQLQTLTNQALSQVRAVSHRLHPPEWQEMTLDRAMESLIESSGLSRRVNLTLSFRAPAQEPSHGAKVQMYRCAQECISNIIRHSGATEANISLETVDDNIVLTVSDNGRGFGPEARNAGIGLRAIRENAASMGGNSSISSNSEGTKIVISLPCTAD